MTSDFSLASASQAPNDERFVKHKDSFNSPHLDLDQVTTPIAISESREVLSAKPRKAPSRAGSSLEQIPMETDSESVAFHPPFGDGYVERDVIDRPRMSITRKTMIRRPED
jgi:hypothetical protein